METRECICGVCPGGCAVTVDLEDDHIVDIRPSGKYGPSAICLRGSKAGDIVDAKDRLTKPLIRTGPRGTYEFREATWEEAWDLAAEKIKDVVDKYGPRALASHVGRGGFDPVINDFIGSDSPGKSSVGIFKPLGSPNDATVGSLCFQAYGRLAPLAAMGLTQMEIAPDIEGAQRVVIWGTNPPTASPPLMYKRLKKAQKRGCTLICVDHYESIMARNSDYHVMVRSGTDGLLILGIINYLISKNKVDRDFIENYTHGFEELKEYVSDFDLEFVSKHTGVPVETIVDLAESIAKPKTALLTYTGLEYSNCGVQTIRAVYSLWALAGHLDRPGGLLLNRKHPKPFREPELPEPADKPIGAEEFPYFCDICKQPQFTKFPEAVLEEKPYKVAGLLNLGSAISINYPNSPRFVEALKALDFYILFDRFLTKDGLYADIIFPSTTYFEDDSYVVYPTGVRRRRRTVRPRGEAKSDLEIMHGIAERLGYGDLYPGNFEELIKTRFQNEPEVMEALLNGEEFIEREAPPAPVYEKYKTGGLRSDGKPGFPTPTGKFELTSELLRKYGYEALPKFEFAKEGPVKAPELAEEYPLIFNSGARIQTTFRTQHLNIPSLVELQKEPFVLLNRKDAEERDIRDGDPVYLSTKRDQIPMTAKVIDGILPGEVEVNVGGGSPTQIEPWSKANVNRLTDNKNIDPISGFPVFKSLLCEVKKRA